MFQTARRNILLAFLGLLALAGAAFLYFRGERPPATDDPLSRASGPAAPANQPAIGSADTTSGKKPTPRSVVAPNQTVRPEERTAEKVAAVVAAYQDLVNKAKAGDTDAQLKLFSALHTCSEAALTPAALDDRIKDMATHVPTDSPNYDVNVRMLTSEYQQCSKFSRPQIDEWRKWLSMAAATGDAQARMFYVSFGRPDDPKSETYLADTRAYNANAQKYLADGVNAGDPMALLQTSGAYSDDPMGGGIGVDPDPIKQYAYLYAYCLATECKNASLAGLQRLASSLSPQDLSNATSQGQAIYKQCCTK